MTTMHRHLATTAALLGFSGAVLAQNVAVPLNYNFNGIVHAGEDQQPDAPNGYRSISDRGLNFTGGIPGALGGYQLVGQPGVLDIVHLGNRNSAAGGAFQFQATANGDNVGIQPTWLTNVDQSGPQTTVLATAMPVDANTKASFLYQISDGGGSFDVTFTLASGGSYTQTLSAGDWFGGPYPGTDSVDRGQTGAAGLNVNEGTIDLSSQAGETVTEITFSNRSNGNAGYAIFACNFEYPLAPSFVNKIPLNYNFNGIVHTGEDELPDDPNGYRSISDRGLNFQGGTPAVTNGVFGDYMFVEQPGVLDIVHLGNRNQRFPFDPTPGGNPDIGIAPNWLPNFDQRTPQTTQLTDLIRMDQTSSASVLFHVSDGGGNFDIEFSFTDGSTVVATVGAGDWFGGPYPGTDSFDRGRTPNAASLHIDEGVVDLSGQAGKILEAISFQNASNQGAGYAIFAMNVAGCVECANGAMGQVTNLGGAGGTSSTISTNSTGSLGCDLDWVVSAPTAPNAPGVWLLGVASTSVPVGLILPGCGGTVRVDNPLLFTSPLDASGGSSYTIELTVANQALCGASVFGQYGFFTGGFCPSLSDGLSITIGN